MGHVNKVSHVFTLGHVAEMLGEDEEWLFEVAEEMDTEGTPTREAVLRSRHRV
jgi:hypothetical protein